MKNADHNRIARKVRRRIPFMGYWWAIGLFSLTWIVVTPLSFVVWLSPGGTQSASGVLFRWLWACVALVKALGTLLPLLLFAAARARTKRGSRLSVSIQLSTVFLGPLSFYAFMSGRLTVAICLIYTFGVVSHAVRAFTEKRRNEWLLSALCGMTAVAFFKGMALIAASSAFALCATEWFAGLWASYTPLFRRSLRIALSGKLSRVEYGATALEACPIGGG